MHYQKSNALSQRELLKKSTVFIYNHFGFIQGPYHYGIVRMNFQTIIV